MSARNDLSGRWRGLFSYPGGEDTTGFTADLTDRGGLLSGRVVEPDLFSPSLAATEAGVDGKREGDTIRFTKFYDDPAGNYDAVLYAGALDATGCEIAGSWDIPGAWSGSFIMIRDVPEDAAAAIEAAETIR